MKFIVIGIILIIVAILLFYVACRALINDVKTSYEASIGAEMSYSATWMLASFIGLFGVMLAGDYTWWCFIPGIIFLYLLSAPMRIYIKERYMGEEFDETQLNPKNNFASFSQSVDSDKEEQD